MAERVFDPMLWVVDAACKGADPKLFFAEERGDVQLYVKARKICERCSVRKTCLDYAMTNEVDVGVWGGLSPLERKRLKRRRAKERARERQGG